jgi:hypothetical protein
VAFGHASFWDMVASSELGLTTQHTDSVRRDGVGWSTEAAMASVNSSAVVQRLICSKVDIQKSPSQGSFDAVDQVVVFPGQIVLITAE